MSASEMPTVPDREVLLFWADRHPRIEILEAVTKCRAVDIIACLMAHGRSDLVARIWETRQTGAVLDLHMPVEPPPMRIAQSLRLDDGRTVSDRSLAARKGEARTVATRVEDLTFKLKRAMAFQDELVRRKTDIDMRLAILIPTQSLEYQRILRQLDENERAIAIVRTRINSYAAAIVRVQQPRPVRPVRPARNRVETASDTLNPEFIDPRSVLLPRNGRTRYSPQRFAEHIARVTTHATQEPISAATVAAVLQELQRVLLSYRSVGAILPGIGRLSQTTSRSTRAVNLPDSASAVIVPSGRPRLTFTFLRSFKAGLPSSSADVPAPAASPQT